MKKTKQNKGITLVALVITIIVLLILAGISLNMVLNENGLISKAQQSVNATEQAKNNELNGLNNLTDQMNNYINGEKSELKIISPINNLTQNIDSTLLELQVIGYKTIEVAINNNEYEKAQISNNKIEKQIQCSQIGENKIKIKATKNDNKEEEYERIIYYWNTNDVESMKSYCIAETQIINYGLENEEFKNSLMSSTYFYEAAVNKGKDSNIISVIKENKEIKGNIVNKLENDWNENLNTISYWCGTKCWLLRGTNGCEGITGGYFGFPAVSGSMQYGTGINAEGIGYLWTRSTEVSSRELISWENYSTCQIKVAADNNVDNYWVQARTYEQRKDINSPCIWACGTGGPVKNTWNTHTTNISNIKSIDYLILWSYIGVSYFNEIILY